MEETAKMALDKVDELIRAAGGLGEQAWPYLIRQNIAEGIVYVAIGVLLAIVIAAFMKWVVIARWNNTNEDERAVSSLLVFGFAALDTLFLATGFLRVINPEYYAIAELLKRTLGG